MAPGRRQHTTGGSDRLARPARPVQCPVPTKAESSSIGQVGFLKSAGPEGAYPTHEFPEIAFAGRSNCGKSSLINTLVGRRRIARVSKIPGRTQLLNFFQVDRRLVLVDLPGYGFARVPEAVRAAWGPMVERYLRDRDCLRVLALLIDIRRDPGTHEHQLREWCRARDLPAVFVATKADKLRPGRRHVRLHALASSLGLRPQALVAFSSVTRQGRERLWRRLIAAADAKGPA